ncbi:hypothetical protein [uncultured Bacteroides sp.]|uniref:hypothetical protein n=1 Tax=uncultured Bacteroides sp. TaxID=162156 RepID=UPI0027D93B97|nr:hypothetical protein [uncultured Bacteroides sp.]
MREYKGEITSAVRIGLGNKNVKVVVRKEYYQFCYEKEKVTHGVLVKIGRGITRLCPQLYSFGYLYIPKDKNKPPILQLFRRAELGGMN